MVDRSVGRIRHYEHGVPPLAGTPLSHPRPRMSTNRPYPSRLGVSPVPRSRSAPLIVSGVPINLTAFGSAVDDRCRDAQATRGSAMRTFTLGSGAERKFVIIEADGTCISITEGKTGVVPKRKEKVVPDAASVGPLIEKMARELQARGYTEQSAARPVAAGKSSRSAPPRPKPAPEPDPVRLGDLFDDDELAAPSSSPLPPIAATATAEPKPKKKKKQRKRSRKEA